MIKFFSAFCCVLFWISTGAAQAPFYQGKTVSIIVGTKAGDAFDLYARLLAQHMPKYIPGSPVASNHLLYMRADAPYKSIGDLVKASEPAKCGASGTTATAYFVPKLLDEVIGTKFNIVTGYQSGSDVDLAIERGEVNCSARTITAFFAREPFHTWRKTGFVRVLMD